MSRTKDGMDLEPETRRLRQGIRQAFEHGWEDTDGGKKPTFPRTHPMCALFERASQGGFDAYAALGINFVELARAQDLPRAVISALIKDLLLAMREVSGNGTLREKVVSHATPFMNVLARRAPRMLVDWAEDMATAKEPLAMVSGALFAGSFDQREACTSGVVPIEGKPYRVASPSFWDMAMASERFPIEIFSLPCPSEEGDIYSGDRRRTIGAILSFASDASVLRIATHIREHATRKMVSQFNKKKEKLCDEPAPVETHLHRVALQDILGAVDARSARRALVADAFGLTEEQSGEEEAS